MTNPLWCDGCGRETKWEEVEPGEYVLPKGWKTTPGDNFACPVCGDLLDELIDETMEELEG